MGRHRAGRKARWQWCGWRFRRIQPGTVWVKDKYYIELLEGALQVARIDLEVIQIKAETEALNAQSRALNLLPAGGSVVTRETRDELLADLPRTADGQLHERALVALVGQNADIDRLLAG